MVVALLVDGVQVSEAVTPVGASKTHGEAPSSAQLLEVVAVDYVWV